MLSKVFGLGLACRAKGHLCHTKLVYPAKSFMEKNSKNGKYPLPLRYEKRPFKITPFKITMYLDLDIIIQLKFRTNFDRCMILNGLN